MEPWQVMLLALAALPAITAAVRSWSAARTEDDAGPERAGNGAGVHDRTEDVR